MKFTDEEPLCDPEKFLKNKRRVETMAKNASAEEKDLLRKNYTTLNLHDTLALETNFGMHLYMAISSRMDSDENGMSVTYKAEELIALFNADLEDEDGNTLTKP